MGKKFVLTIAGSGMLIDLFKSFLPSTAHSKDVFQEISKCAVHEMTDFSLLLTEVAVYIWLKYKQQRKGKEWTCCTDTESPFGKLNFFSSLYVLWNAGTWLLSKFSQMTSSC